MEGRPVSGPLSRSDSWTLQQGVKIMKRSQICRRVAAGGKPTMYEVLPTTPHAMPPERPESSTTRLFVRRLAISSEFCVDGHRRRLDGTVSILRTYLVQGDHGDHCRQIITATPCQKEGKDESDNCTSRGQGSRGGQRVLLEAWAIGYMVGGSHMGYE